VKDCRSAEALYLYLEGELGPDEARELEAHLAACPACREALAERRLLHEAFTSLPSLEVPPDFALSVMDRIPEAAEPKAGWLAALASGSVALVTCLLGFYRLTGQDLSEVLVAFSRSLGSGFGRLLPLLAKLWKLGDIFLRLTTDLALTLGKGLGFVSDLLGPGLLGLVLCLGVLITLLLLYGARRLLSLGERP
jgi:predicted anti-sigma-YlaC factor YlaD